MRAMLERRDSLVVLPTGGGKSLCYGSRWRRWNAAGQERGHGPTVVISPLIALMKDQVDSLKSLGVPAAQMDSSLSPEERRQVASDLRSGEIAVVVLFAGAVGGRGRRGWELVSGVAEGFGCEDVCD